MRSILVGVIVFVAASVIVALNVRHNEKISTSLFVRFARETPAAGAPAESAESTTESSAKPTNLPIQLIGTIVRVDHSMATIRIPPAERENVFVESHFGAGGIAWVTRIERERLYFKLDGAEEYYVRIQPYDSTQAFSREAMNAAGAAKEFQVRRADVDQQLGNLPQLLMSARAEPVVDKSGRITGYRIAAMDDTSFFKKLGLEPGDILTEVNGTKLESLEGVMKLFEELRNSSMIQMKASRAGRDLQLTYLIR